MPATENCTSGHSRKYDNTYYFRITVLLVCLVLGCKSIQVYIHACINVVPVICASPGSGSLAAPTHTERAQLLFSELLNIGNSIRIEHFLQIHSSMNINPYIHMLTKIKLKSNSTCKQNYINVKPLIRYNRDWNAIAEDELRIFSIIHLWLYHLLQLHSAALYSYIHNTDVNINTCKRTIVLSIELKF